MEKVFIVRIKKKEVERKYLVPRHPEFVVIKKLSESEWMAKNSSTQEVVRITRKEKGKFVEYTIS